MNNNNSVIVKRGVGRPRSSTRVYTKSSQEGLNGIETRATFIVKEDILERLKDLAGAEGKLIKELINEAIEDILSKYGK